MLWWKLRHVLRKPEGEGDGAGGAAVAAPPPATTGAAPAAAPAASPAPAPAASTPAAAPAAATGDETKGFWNDGWRERLAGGDDKVLAQLQRYASPEAVWQKTRSLEQRLSSGEFKPVLAKDATPEQLKDYRAAHGIPEDPTKYDLGKDFKVDDKLKPVVDELLKAAHKSNQTPQQARAAIDTLLNIQKVALERQDAHDVELQTKTEDVLRGEWGAEFRRNMNLVHGLLDGSGSQDLKDKLLGGRLSDGTPIGSSPDALRMLLGLALVKNPAGVVVPGGGASSEEGVRAELDKLAAIPTSKKTGEQSERERALIDAAIAGGFMDASGKWKK